LINPTDLELTDHQQKLAIMMMGPLVRAVSLESPEMGASSQDLHKVLTFMAAMVLETDEKLTAPSHFREAGDYLGAMVGAFARKLRHEHQQSGYSLMDMAASADESAVN